MPKSKTIKKILEDFNKFSEKINADFVSPGFIGNEQIKDFLLSSLLSLLDEVEKRVSNYGDAQALESVLSDLRKEIN